MDVEDLKVLRSNLEKVVLISGSSEKIPLESEGLSRLIARRFIVLRCNLAKGTEITEDAITYKHPAHGNSIAQSLVSDDTESL